MPVEWHRLVADICGVSGARANSKYQDELSGCTGTCGDPGYQHACLWLQGLTTGAQEWKPVTRLRPVRCKLTVEGASCSEPSIAGHWPVAMPELGPHAAAGPWLSASTFMAAGSHHRGVHGTRGQ